jgi:hypothetical protein
MSNRTHIQSGTLVYTCNCGWLDLNHLESKERKYASPKYLWEDVLHERGIVIGNQNDRHVIKYKQHMAKYFLSSEYAKYYWIKKNLPIEIKRAIALSIFMEVSLGFENLQSSMSAVTDSGFSEEDLPSNLIGFYSIVFGSIDWRGLCRPVSKESSFNVWDINGPVGKNKNRAFAPIFHDCKECVTKHHINRPSFPQIFNSIIPQGKGIYFDEYTEDKVVPRHMISTLFE